MKEPSLISKLHRNGPNASSKTYFPAKYAVTITDDDATARFIGNDNDDTATDVATLQHQQTVQEAAWMVMMTPPTVEISATKKKQTTMKKKKKKKNKKRKQTSTTSVAVMASTAAAADSTM